MSQPQPLSVAEVQGLIENDEAVLAIDLDDKNFGWLITKNAADWADLNSSAQDVEAKVKTLRASLVFTSEKPFDAAAAYSLYKMLLQPFASRLGSVKRLSIVTNGALTSLPFGLLIRSDPRGKALKNMDWLIRPYAITVLPSIGSLKVLRNGSRGGAAQKPMVAFADPVFSRAPPGQTAELRSLPNFIRGGQVDLAALSRALPQLPETADEVRAIASVLNADKNDLKLGYDASETVVKRTKLDDYRIVYFATHGLVAGDVKQFSNSNAEPALALSIPQKPSELDDGLLTSSEVAQLKLDADWVVLSACNTAAADKPGAEALSGLARAFFYAGARSLVVSHWEVSSQATVDLMIGMFLASSRDHNLSHAQALQQSMLAMIDGASSDAAAHPRFWARFVIVGEPRPGNEPILPVSSTPVAVTPSAPTQRVTSQEVAAPTGMIEAKPSSASGRRRRNDVPRVLRQLFNIIIR